MKIQAIFLLLVLLISSCATESTSTPKPTSSSPNCVKGKPCGKSCIARDKVCHKSLDPSEMPRDLLNYPTGF
jgi:hypothetical protein